MEAHDLTTKMMAKLPKIARNCESSAKLNGLGIAKKAGVSSTTLIDSLAYDLPTIVDVVSGQQIQRGTRRNDGIGSIITALCRRAARQLKLMSHDENATLKTVMFTRLRHRIDCAERHSTLIALILKRSHVAAVSVLLVGTRHTALVSLQQIT